MLGDKPKCFRRGFGASHRRSVFEIFIISYLVLLIVPLGISVLAYHQMQGTVRDNILHTNYVERAMLAEQFDAQISVVENLMARIAGGQNFTDILKKIQEEKDIPFSESLLLSQELRNAKLNIEIVTEAYIFFKDADLVVSNMTATNKKIAYEVYHKNDDFSRSDWEALMTQRHNRELRSVFTSVKNFSAKKEIVYLQSLPLSLGTGEEATLVIFLDTDQFMDMFEEIPDVQGDIFVTDSSGNTLVASSSMEVEPDLMAHIIETDDLVHCKYNHKNYIAASNRSGSLKGIYYVSMMPEEVFLLQSVKIRNIGLISIALIVVIGLGLVFYFSRRNIAPIHNMVKYVKKTMGAENEENEDDIRYIMGAMAQVRKKMFSTEKDLRVKKRVSKNYFLRELLMDEFSAGGIDYTQAKENEVYCESGNYMVILLYVYEYQSFFGDLSTLEQSEQEQMVHFILSNVLLDLFEETNHCQMVHLDGFTSACIVYVGDNADAARDKIENVMETAHDFIGSNFQIYFTAAVSGCHEFCRLNEAYTEAVAVAYYGKPDDETLALNMEFYQESQSGELNIVDELFERKFTNYLRGQSIEEAKACLNEFFASCSAYMPEYGAMLKYNLLLIVLKIMPGDKRTAFIEKTMPFARLAKCKSFSAVENTFYSLLDEAKAFLPSPVRTASKFCDAVIAYVTDKYSDINLSISMIADHFEMSTNSLSMHFKEETGESLKTYINAVRIEKAKELLMTTSKKLDEIAAMVGFIGSNAFIRTFKRYEGVTPGRYREIAQQDS